MGSVADAFNVVDIQLFQAVDVLSQCRTTLMYSYAFAFFMIKNNQMLIFEMNLSFLEEGVEKLSKLLDEHLRFGPSPDVQMKVRCLLTSFSNIQQH